MNINDEAFEELQTELEEYKNKVSDLEYDVWKLQKTVADLTKKIREVELMQKHYM